jgi:solute carrier family 25 protein 39/40
MHFTGTIDALTKLVRYEGVSSLWRGLSPQLLLSIPSTVVYFWAYDELKHTLQRLTTNPHPPSFLTPIHPYLTLFSPLLAGTSARALTTILVSPIELIRTKTQSLSTSPSMLTLAQQEIAKGGWRSLWRGANPTLWRDVPFSAFYWTSYEWIKGEMMTRMRKRRGEGGDRGVYERSLLWTSFVAGASSGMVSAFFTHPFDLVKTRRQIEMYQLVDGIGGEDTERVKGRTATFSMLRVIVKEEGWVGLTTGMLARMSKIVPACAIMISTYEISKEHFGRAHQVRREEKEGSQDSSTLRKERLM